MCFCRCCQTRKRSVVLGHRIRLAVITGEGAETGLQAVFPKRGEPPPPASSGHQDLLPSFQPVAFFSLWVQPPRCRRGASRTLAQRQISDACAGWGGRALGSASSPRRAWQLVTVLLAVTLRSRSTCSSPGVTQTQVLCSWTSGHAPGRQAGQRPCNSSRASVFSARKSFAEAELCSGRPSRVVAPVGLFLLSSLESLGRRVAFKHLSPPPPPPPPSQPQ